MRIVLLTCALSLALTNCGGGTPAPAQPEQPAPTPTPAPDPAPPPTPTPPPAPVAAGQCATDADCTWSAAAVCPGCCHCASVMTVAQEHQLQEMAARARCAAPDCAHVRCEPCANRPARIVCEAGACVGKNDGVPSGPPSGPEAATS